MNARDRKAIVTTKHPVVHKPTEQMNFKSSASPASVGGTQGESMISGVRSEADTFIAPM
jgi:hypothetical protein